MNLLPLTSLLQENVITAFVAQPSWYGGIARSHPHFILAAHSTLTHSHICSAQTSHCSAAHSTPGSEARKPHVQWQPARRCMPADYGFRHHQNRGEPCCPARTHVHIRIHTCICLCLITATLSAYVWAQQSTNEEPWHQKLCLLVPLQDFGLSKWVKLWGYRGWSG